MIKLRLTAAALSLLASLAAVPTASAFVHPGISHSQTDLDRMKNNVNVEPYKTAYAAFSSSNYSSSSNHGHGAVTAVVNGGAGQFAIRHDAQVAHWNAVMWYVTNNAAYRDNAINIMMNWANTLTSFDVSDHITAATCVFEFCNAAEIIRYTGGGAWSAADIANFQNWMITYLYPPLLTPGNSIAANQLQAAGHGGLQIKGLIAMGIFCDRQDIYNFGVSSYQHNGNYSYGLQEYIHSSGQNYENQRDQGHASGNIGTFAESAYMAWNQGQDLFGIAGNLLAKAFESQAKIDLLYDVTPVTWFAADGSPHQDISPDARQPFDNLQVDIALAIFRDVKNLAMPYTWMQSNLKFPMGGLSFFYRLDGSGKVPVAPLYGQPAATDVVLFGNGSYSGSVAHFGPSSFDTAALAAVGMGNDTASSIRVPAGWTATLYENGNFTGASVVLSANGSLGDIGFNDRTSSMVVTSGGSYTISSGTYRLVNRNSNRNADTGYSVADAAPALQSAYVGDFDQLWRVEDMGYGNGQYRLTNLLSNKVLQVRAASLSDGAAVEQWGNVDEATSPNLATGGTGGALQSYSGEPAGNLFDGNPVTKWSSGAYGGVGWLRYQFASGVSKVITQYRLVSANDVPARDPKDWQFQGSNDGTNWTTLDTQSGQVFSGRLITNAYNVVNATPYAQYRLNITANQGGNTYGMQLAEFGLYSSRLSLAANGSASASSSGGTETPDKVFDGNPSTKWSNGLANGTGWLRYDFPAGVTRVITRYRLTSANDVPARDPKNWQFQGSNDGTSWTVLDTRNGETFPNRFQAKTYNFSNSTAYAYYRLSVTANQGGGTNGIQLGELGLFSSQYGANHQRWSFTPVSGSAYGSYFQISNVNSGRNLDVAGSSTAENAALLQRNAGSATSQQWSLQLP